MTPEEVQALVRELNASDAAYALVTVVRALAPTSAYLGAQAVILADGTLHGWIGGGCATNVIIGAAQRAIENGEPKLVRISNDRLYAEEDVEQYAMSCASNGSVELFIQPNSTRSVLCVLGNTPAAEEARFLAERLRIRLADSPDAAPIVLVATQGQGDEEALETALRSPARQVLMIASRRKAERLRNVMRMRGLDSELARLQAPAGPDAGAKTPGEIAFVAMVGVLAAFRGHGETPVRTQSDPGQTTETGSEDSRAPNVGHAPRSVQVDAKFVNPVCGNAVSIAQALHVERYANDVYYFCCDGCWTTFCKDPAKYASSRAAN
jgi:xanthine dehydrogenase accessory factor